MKLIFDIANFPTRITGLSNYLTMILARTAGENRPFAECDVHSFSHEGEMINIAIFSGEVHPSDLDRNDFLLQELAGLGLGHIACVSSLPDINAVACGDLPRLVEIVRTQALTKVFPFTEQAASEPQFSIAIAPAKSDGDDKESFYRY